VCYTAVHVEAYNLVAVSVSSPQSQALDLSVGRALPRVNLTLDERTVESYIASVDDQTGIYRRTGLVPPLAVAAIAKKRLMEVLHIPDGAIQSQAIFDFMGVVKSEETLHCRGVISEHWMRNSVNYVAVDIRVNGMNRRCVLKGRMGFILAPAVDRGV
jgi:hypothetical protein